MKVVVVQKWRTPRYRVMDAAHALTPDPNDRDDTIDRLSADVRDLQAIIGRLMAHMLERDAVALEEAQKIVGLHGCDLEIHEPGTFGVD